MRVGVIGAGAWGTALAIIVSRGGSDVVLWSYDGEIKHFEDVVMPQNVIVTSNMSDLSSADVWLIVTPAAYFRGTVRQARRLYRGQPVIICTKGAESSTGQFMSEIIKSEMPECEHFGVLSGPQFAAEVARGVPTGSTLAGDDVAIHAGKQVLNLLDLTPSNDVIGAELCGVGKNAVSLICGYNTVKSCGENERALIYTKAWGEVVNIGRANGAHTETFLGLCGIGDLFLSATSPTSRNFSGGMAIAHGNPPQGTVEGIFALQGLITRAEKIGLDVPVLREMQIKMGLNTDK